MAHYARLGFNNVVVQVDRIENSDITNSGGLERDSLAFEHLSRQFGAGIWVKCSYNTYNGIHSKGGTPLRANFPGGAYNEDDPWYYDGTHDLFRKGRPKDRNGKSCASYTLDTTDGGWECPIDMPVLTDEEKAAGKSYLWDESVYQADNTKGWILT